MRSLHLYIIIWNCQERGGEIMEYIAPEITSYTAEDLLALELACGTCCGGVCCAAGGSRD